MQNKIFNYQQMPISSSVLATIGGILLNVLSTPAFVGLAAAAPYALLKHIRVNNLLTTMAVTVSLFKSTIASGVALTTQSFALSSVSVPAASYVDWYGQARLESTDYLLGQSWGTTTSVTNIEIDGELGIA
jgi:small ligand-binding sensory domain FIST